MISQLLALVLGSLLFAIGLVSLIGLRRLAEGAAIVAIAAPLAAVLFVALAAGLFVYRMLHGG